jgi:hypothetical protein
VLTTSPLPGNALEIAAQVFSRALGSRATPLEAHGRLREVIFLKLVEGFHAAILLDVISEGGPDLAGRFVCWLAIMQDDGRALELQLDDCKFIELGYCVPLAPYEKFSTASQFAISVIAHATLLRIVVSGLREDDPLTDEIPIPELRP